MSEYANGPDAILDAVIDFGGLDETAVRRDLLTHVLDADRLCTSMDDRAYACAGIARIFTENKGVTVDGFALLQFMLEHVAN